MTPVGWSDTQIDDAFVDGESDSETELDTTDAEYPEQGEDYEGEDYADEDYADEDYADEDYADDALSTRHDLRGG